LGTGQTVKVSVLGTVILGIVAALAIWFFGDIVNVAKLPAP